MTFTQKFYTLVALQLVLILGLMGSKQLTLRMGERFLLRTAPVDPMDTFRGEYVHLGYETLTEVESMAVEGPPPVKGEILYVSLARVGRFATRAAVSRTPPTDALAYLRGTVVGADKTHCRVEYGIESWFVPRGQGPELEREAARKDRQLLAEIAVDRGGHAALRAVTVEPTPFSRSPHDLTHDE